MNSVLDGFGVRKLAAIQKDIEDSALKLRNCKKFWNKRNEELGVVSIQMMLG